MGKKSRIKKERRIANNDYILNILVSLRFADEKGIRILADYVDGFIIPDEFSEVISFVDILDVKNETALKLLDYADIYSERMKDYMSYMFDFIDSYGNELVSEWNESNQLEERVRWLHDIGYDISKLI